MAQIFQEVESNDDNSPPVEHAQTHILREKKKVESVKCYINGSTEAAVAASGRLAFRWTAWEEELQQMSEKWSCFTTQLLSNGCSGWWENGAWLLASTLSSCPRTYIFSKIRLFSYKILSWSSSGGKINVFSVWIVFCETNVAFKLRFSSFKFNVT